MLCKLVNPRPVLNIGFAVRRTADCCRPAFLGRLGVDAHMRQGPPQAGVFKCGLFGWRREAGDEPSDAPEIFGGIVIERVAVAAIQFHECLW